VDDLKSTRIFFYTLFMRKEKKKILIRMIISVDICLFLIFGNYGMCGIVGDTVAHVMFGLTGGMWHILPVYVLIMYMLLILVPKKRIPVSVFFSSILIISATGAVL